MGFLSSIFKGIKKAVRTVARVVKKVVNFVGDKIVPIAQIVATIARFIPLPIAQVIARGAQIIATVGTAVVRVVNGVVEVPTTIFNDIQRALGTSVSSQMFGAQGTVGSLGIAVADRVASFTGDLFEKLKEFIQKIISPVVDALRGAVTFVRDLGSSVIAKLRDLAGSAFERLKTLAVRVFEIVTDLAIRGVNLLRTAGAKIGAFFQLVSEAAQRLWERVRDAVVSGVNTVFGLADSAFQRISGVLGDLPGVLREQFTAFRESLETAVGERIKAIPEGIWSVLETVWDRATGAERVDMARVFEATLYTATTPPATRAEAREFYQVAAPTSAIGAWLAGIMIFIFSIMGQTGALAAPQIELLQQEAYFNAPGKLLDPRDIVESERRGLLTRDQALERLRFWGYGTDRGGDMLALRDNTIPEPDAVSWWLRGLMDDAAFKDNLKRRGWIATDIERLQTAAFFIPPPQDLIQMAVREVFTPRLVEAFGLDEDFPDEFGKFARQQGISNEWAHRYWQAHWVLPSLQMGFEMLHRQVIDDSQLVDLMRAQDIMPGWREPLRQISFTPFTRVDIRRMAKLEILDSDQVVLAYRDIGYSVEKAEQLRDFTERLNKPRQVDDANEVTQITRASVISLFRDGIIQRGQAEELLATAGIEADAAQLFLQAAELEEQRAERSAEIDLVIDQTRAGLLTFDEAQDKMATLGLETQETTKALAALVRDTNRKTRLPTRADLDKMIKTRLIDRTEYIDTLGLLGYSERWAEKFLTLATQG